MIRPYGSRITALGGCLCVISFIFLAYAVSTGRTIAFDESLRSYINSYASPNLTTLFLVISYTGKVVFLIGSGSLVALIFAYSRRYRWLVLFLVTMAGEIILELASKAIFSRTRPEPFFGLTPAESYSFPSGHALGSLCFYGVLAWLISRESYRRTRALTITATAVWILLIGLARVYLGMHYPTDVLAGYLLGGAWLAAVIVKGRKKEKGG